MTEEETLHEVPETDGNEKEEASLSFAISQSLLKLMSTELVMLSNDLVLSHSLLLLPSIVPSIRVFSNESVPHIRWPKYWSFNFSFSPSNEYSELISFRMNWLDLLAVFSNTTIQKQQFLAAQLFFIVQLSHPYMTTGKTTALTIRTTVSK